MSFPQAAGALERAPDRLGAIRIGAGRWRFVLWAPHLLKPRLHVLSPTERHVALETAGRGYHVAEVDDLVEGARYRFVADDGRELADPASRAQPDGVFGPSQLFDASSYDWRDPHFVPVELEHLVIYELHVGAFSAEGTFAGATRHLDRLAALGINAVEPMPIAAFPGVRNWGYDGVFPFAVQESYGGPRQFQVFVDACHERDLSVILDVVYNHLGPEGSVLGSFGPYTSDHYRTPWGAAMNVDQAGSDEVRRYLVENACAWCAEFHVDGLRLDAVHAIIDTSAYPFVAELSDAVHALGAELGRPFLVIAESADNNPRVITPSLAGGLGCDAQWADDFHHALHVAATGETDGYYLDYADPERLARAVTRGYAFEGEYSAFRDHRHGVRSAEVIAASRFVVAAQNHDQIGNRRGAERLSTLVSPAMLRVVAGVLLLGPHVPLLFMGEEYGETAPFPFFIDPEDPGLLEAIRSGRDAEFGGPDRFDPGSPETLRVATLSPELAERPENRALTALYRRLLGLRREVTVVTDPRAVTRATVEHETLVVRREGPSGSMTAAFNFSGAEVAVRLGEGAAWSLLVSSAETRFGGSGEVPPAEVGGGSSITVSGSSFCCYLGPVSDG